MLIYVIFVCKILKYLSKETHIGLKVFVPPQKIIIHQMSLIFKRNFFFSSSSGAEIWQFFHLLNTFLTKFSFEDQIMSISQTQGINKKSLSSFWKFSLEGRLGLAPFPKHKKSRYKSPAWTWFWQLLLSPLLTFFLDISFIFLFEIRSIPKWCDIGQPKANAF